MKVKERGKISKKQPREIWANIETGKGHAVGKKKENRGNGNGAQEGKWDVYEQNTLYTRIKLLRNK